MLSKIVEHIDLIDHKSRVLSRRNWLLRPKFFAAVLEFHFYLLVCCHQLQKSRDFNRDNRAVLTFEKVSPTARRMELTTQQVFDFGLKCQENIIFLLFFFSNQTSFPNFSPGFLPPPPLQASIAHFEKDWCILFLKIISSSFKSGVQSILRSTFTSLIYFYPITSSSIITVIVSPGGFFFLRRFYRKTFYKTFLKTFYRSNI